MWNGLEFFLYIEYSQITAVIIRACLVLELYNLDDITSLCTCVAQSVKGWTSDLDVTGVRPPVATRHIRYVLLVNSPMKWNLLLCLLIYFCN